MFPKICDKLQSETLFLTALIDNVILTFLNSLLHYENMSMQYTAISHGSKMKNFR